MLNITYTYTVLVKELFLIGNVRSMYAYFNTFKKFENYLNWYHIHGVDYSSSQIKKYFSENVEICLFAYFGHIS